MKYSYQQIQESDDRIWELFKGQCIHCFKKACVIHEVHPRSLNVNWLEDDNRVTLCIDCHFWAHHQGTKYSAPILKIEREDWIKKHVRQ